MTLSETRYVKIDGTSVVATVNTADEARIAVKELRHKKREFQHIKRLLLRQKKAAEAQAARARKRKAKPRSFLARAGAALDMLWRLPGAYGRAREIMDVPKLERECARTDEILHNLDAVLLQIEGRLIHHS